MAAPSGYGYYKEITIQHANIDGNLTDVPTLIQIVDDSDIGGHLEDATTGHDIRFYDVDTDAEIYFDRVYLNVAAGDCNATFYVKCPYLYTSPTGNENKIRIYYGKAADSDGQDRANTWSDYVGVWHMADASGTVTDATGSHSSASQTITDYQAAGRVRYAMEFDGTNDGALIADAAALDQNIFTLQAWINADAWSGADYMMRRLDTNGGVGGTADGFAVAATGSGGTERLDFNIYEDGVVGDGQTANGSGGIGAWYLCHGTVDSGGVVRAYMDGTVGTNTHDFGGGITITGDVGMGLGCSEAGAGNNVFDGHMEEVRYRSSALSANQIKFEFNNMDSSVNADFELTWGAETAVSGTPKSVSDSGSGSDVIGSILSEFTVAETGSGADIIAALKASLSVADVGAGADAITAQVAALLIADAGVGVEAIAGIEVAVLVTDSGKGVIVISVPQAIGELVYISVDPGLVFISSDGDLVEIT